MLPLGHANHILLEVGPRKIIPSACHAMPTHQWCSFNPCEPQKGEQYEEDIDDVYILKIGTKKTSSNYHSATPSPKTVDHSSNILMILFRLLVSF